MAGPSETQESLEVDVTLDGGVLKLITKPGDGGRPKSGDEVTVHYTGTLDDGTEFDSSRKRGSPFKFTLGKGEVIQGWDKGVETMQRGECCMLTIDPHYGYGSRKMGQIPENSRLKFDIELIDFGPAKKDKWTMATEEKIQAAIEAKEKGNDLFKKGEKVAATAAYLEGIEYFEGFDDWAENAKMQARPLKLALHLNSANSFYQAAAWHEAALQATAALLLDPSNVKALYRRGATRMELKEYDFAREDIVNAVRLDPQNVEIRRLLKTCTDLITEERRHDATKFGGMFSKFAMYSDKFSVRDLSKMPKVFMSIKVGDAEPKRLILALYADTVPKTVENFRALCAGTNGMGSKGKPLHYKGSIFHRVIPGFVMQGGDFTNGDGTGGESIYGERFPDEKFTDTHSKRGLLSMANAGPNTNGSQFFVTFDVAPHLDGKHVVFGEVIEGFEVLDAVENAPTDKEKPKDDVVILDCGEA